MLLFKLRKLAPVGAPLLKEKVKFVNLVTRVTSTSSLVNLHALKEILVDCERTCICYEQRQNVLKRNRMTRFFKTRPQLHTRKMKIPQKTVCHLTASRDTALCPCPQMSHPSPY
jgi:hypothetical protein